MKVKKLGRSKSHREAMLSNIASSLILNEYIVTTKAKAKACKAYIGKVITVGKKKSLNARRKVIKLLGDKIAADKVFDVLSDRYKDRVGGYSYMVRLGTRKGDNAAMVKLILVGAEPVREKSKVKTKKKIKDEKKKKKEQEKKRSILDRVRDLRGKLKDDKVKKDQFEGRSKQVEKKSRSGI